MSILIFIAILRYQEDGEFIFISNTGFLKSQQKHLDSRLSFLLFG